jgi:hypothetical protein
MATSEQITEIAREIWPGAKNIEVAPYKAGHSAWSGAETMEGFKLTISGEDGCLIAQVIAASLDGLKTKLEQRSRKRHWGSFE